MALQLMATKGTGSFAEGFGANVRPVLPLCDAKRSRISIATAEMSSPRSRRGREFRLITTTASRK